MCEYNKRKKIFSVKVLYDKYGKLEENVKVN